MVKIKKEVNVELYETKLIVWIIENCTCLKRQSYKFKGTLKKTCKQMSNRNCMWQQLGQPTIFTWK